jgi:hypothetical protein
MLVRRLQKHALSKTPIMDDSQIKAAAILLKKVVPDLTSVEHTGEISHKHVSELTAGELIAELAQVRAAIAGAVEQGSGESQPAGVH